MVKISLHELEVMSLQLLHEQTLMKIQPTYLDELQLILQHQFSIAHTNSKLKPHLELLGFQEMPIQRTNLFKAQALHSVVLEKKKFILEIMAS